MSATAGLSFKMGGEGTVIQATDPKHPRNAAADWQCINERSHGTCYTVNAADEKTCRACGEDRPTETSTDPQQSAE